MPWTCSAGDASVRSIALSCALFLLAIAVAQSQNPDPLPRRGWFGVALGPHERGALVTSVVDGSSAALAGVRAGDVITAVDDTPVPTPNAVIAAVAQHAGGDTATIDLLRDDRPQQLSVVLRALPHETLPGVTFEYGSVTLSDGSRLRTILSVPEQRQEPLPAVMLLQGGGCGTMDTPIAGPMAEPLRTIAVHGYVTIRVDKSGVGDSQGPPCATIGYAQELEGYRAALTALRGHSSVDPGRVYLLGLSLGGVFAPVLARESAVRGIVVFGTLASPPSPYPGRSERFFREFAAVDIPAAWSAVDARVLALHGQFDEVAREADHARIAALVNAGYPGRASHQQLAGLDHCGTRHESMSRSQGNCGNGEVVSALNDAILAFLSAEPSLRGGR